MLKKYTRLVSLQLCCAAVTAGDDRAEEKQEELQLWQ